ncbi:MAG: DNA-directed RNA polymerase subunit alpha C-terminal domain-containing protein [Anaerolineae bacterium]
MKRLQQRDSIREQVEQTRQEASDAPADMHISELDLSSRFEDILVEAGLTSFSDLLALFNEQGDEGLLNISGIGQQTLLEIKKGLRRHGHDLPVSEA